MAAIVGHTHKNFYLVDAPPEQMEAEIVVFHDETVVCCELNQYKVGLMLT